MDFAVEKSLLRQTFRKKRSALTPEEVADKSQKIAEKFIQDLLPKIYSPNCGKSFSLYLPSNNEVQTAAIAEFFLKNNIKFSYPKITTLTSPLEFLIYSSDQKFAPNQFFPKLLEPQNGEKNLPDIIILPLLAFDHDLSRLGMGGGFFDRTLEFLKKEKSEIITIGLAYDIQRSHEKIPMTKTDQSLDFIVTEKNVFLRS